ncbi:uncharacterized protein LOC144943655 [Lampetra fluviatilis]
MPATVRWLAALTLAVALGAALVAASPPGDERAAEDVEETEEAEKEADEIGSTWPSHDERDDCPALCSCSLLGVNRSRAVDCRGVNLTALPLRLPGGAQALLLTDHAVVELPPGDVAMRGYEEVAMLDLSRGAVADACGLRLGGGPGPWGIRDLRLVRNDIAALRSGCFESLGGLESLYLGYNRIGSVSGSAFAGLGSLRTLFLDHNVLRSVDAAWFDALPGLRVLALGGNPVASVTDGTFSRLRQLRSLDLSEWRVSRLQEAALDGLEHLEDLSLEGNLLAKVPAAALRRLPGLRLLRLDRNPIVALQEGDFRNLSRVEELSVRDMPRLAAVDSDAFESLPSLASLDLSHNPRLSFVHRYAFRDAPRLATLLLDNGDLGGLHGAVARALPALRRLSLHSNPLRCDCVNRWWLGATAWRGLEVARPELAVCAEPPEARGRPAAEAMLAAAARRRADGAEPQEACLPLIARGALPARTSARPGSLVTLYCRALGDPEPTIYWVSPAGDKVTTDTLADKFWLEADGTLSIAEVRESDAGVYTCVAFNSEGADTRSVTLRVGGDSGDASRGHVSSASTSSSPSISPSTSSSTSSPSTISSPATAASSVKQEIEEEEAPTLAVVEVDSFSALVAWRVSSKLSSGVSGKLSGSVSELRWWHSAEGPRGGAHSAAVAPGVTEHRVAELQPGTTYTVCATTATSSRCVNLTTTAAAAAEEGDRRGPPEPPVRALRHRAGAATRLSLVYAVLAALGLLGFVLLVARYARHRLQRKLVQGALAGPFNAVYPPLSVPIDYDDDDDDDDDGCDGGYGGGYGARSAGGSKRGCLI